MPEHPDLTLLRSFTNGNHSALAELAVRYERPMLGMAAGLLSDRESAQDAVQETWVRVIRFSSGFKHQSSVKTWLYRILINVCHDHHKKNNKSQQGAEPLAHAAASDSTNTENPELQQAVNSLNWNHRATLLLCYHRGMTHEHAAESLGIPLGTLKSRLHAALEELRRTAPQEVCNE